MGALSRLDFDGSLDVSLATLLRALVDCLPVGVVPCIVTYCATVLGGVPVCMPRVLDNRPKHDADWA